MLRDGRAILVGVALASTACGGQVLGGADSGADGGVACSTHFTGGVAVVTAGFTDTCAITTDQRAWCFGANAEGEIGDGTMNGQPCPYSFEPCDPSPVRVASIDQAVAISANYRHACAVKPDGTIWCWGDNEFGESGDGTTTGEQPCLNENAAPCDPTPVEVATLHDAVTISAGFGHNCALDSNGAVWCWGEDGSGQVGDAMKSAVACLQNVPCVPSPFEITSLGKGVKAIAAGGFDTCAIQSDDTLWCWGDNEFGSLGDGTTNPSPTPIQVPVGTVTAVATGFSHTCAIKTDGTLWCWGRNDGGQVGDGTTTGATCSFTVCRPSPVQVSALGANVRAVAASDTATCAIKTDGTLWCWGNNDSGQLGTGAASPQPSPMQVNAVGADVVSVSVGDMHTCAIRADGSLLCWGEGGDGELGSDPSNSTASMQPVRFCD